MSNKSSTAKKNFSATPNLSQIALGQSCRVEKVNASAAATLRLAELGLGTGAIVKVVRVAPLGDPMEISLRGYRLCLRKETAAHIDVSKTP